MPIVVLPRAANAPTATPRDQRRITVPWRTVLTLAVVLAYADGFWLTSLRGAVGAIERTQSPFASWLRESTVLLPVFVLAVLAALTVAMHWVGPVLRGPRAISTASLLVVAATTLGAVAVSAANAVYDYRLQTTHLVMMDSMRSLCVSSCLEQARRATLDAHVHGVLLISRYLLVTNLVLVAWVVVMWGGRLRLFGTRPARLTPSPEAGEPQRPGTPRLFLVAALLGAAAVHAAVTDRYLATWPLAGMFFLVLVLWEIGLAGMLLARLESRAFLAAAAAMSGGSLVLWIGYRTLGWPAGPDVGPAVAVGVPELAAGLLELGVLLAAVALLRTPHATMRSSGTSAHVAALGLVAVIAVTALGVAGTGPSWFNAFGVAPSNAVTPGVATHQHG